MIEGYFRQLERTIAETVGVHSSHITYDKRSTTIGFVRGDIYFTDGSLLHLREFVSTERGIERYMYVYHYQQSLPQRSLHLCFEVAHDPAYGVGFWGGTGGIQAVQASISVGANVILRNARINHRGNL